MLVVDLDMPLDLVRDSQEFKNSPRVVANPEPCPDFSQLCGLLVYRYLEARLFQKGYGRCKPSGSSA